MHRISQHKKELEKNGFSLVQQVFTSEEIHDIKQLINLSNEYAIRQFFAAHPLVEEKLFQNKQFSRLMSELVDSSYFITKSIYFNKPAQSNWFVAYHQDMSISAKTKKEAKGYLNWTQKKGQLGVVPPLNILENTITLRIHLDDTDETNGALKVISKSHNQGFIRVDENFKATDYGNEEICTLKEGGVMLMKPLLLHASERSISNQDRAVIHIELCNQEIPMGWLEKKVIV